MAPLPRPRIPAILFRAAVGITVAAMAAACNLRQLSSAETTATETSGEYASAQQAVQGAQQGSDGLNCTDLLTGRWYLCVRHRIDVTFPPYAKGTIWQETTSPNCVRLIANQQGLAPGMGIDVPIEVNGAVASDDVCCRASGKGYLSLNASGECVAGVATITVTEYWGNAQADLQCECVDPKKDCHADEASGPITLGGLGDQSFTFRFEVKKGGSCQPLSLPPAGLISGTLNYCFQDSEDVPFVGLVPLTCP